MTADLPDSALELRSLVTSQGTLELSLHDVPVPTPAANEVLVRVEASPINPSDLGVLIAGAEMATATVTGTTERPVVTASLGERALAGLSARVDKPLPVGNEGAGTVVAAGSSPGGASPAGEDGGDRRRRDVLAVPSDRCFRLSRPAGRVGGEGWGVILRQPVDGSRNAGNHAPRGSFRPGAHGCGVEPWPDARQALRQRRCAAGQYRPQARPGGVAAARSAQSMS